MPAVPRPTPRPSHTTTRTQRRMRLGLLAVALLPALLLAALGAYALQQSRAQYVLRAELLTQNLASALDRSVSANVEKIDLMLNAVVDALEQQLATGALDPDRGEALLRSKSTLWAHIDGLRVTDARGIGILGPGLRGGAPVDFSDRAWFKAQRDRPDAGLHMSQPLVSKLSGTWIVSFSRRYRNAQGEFAGAVSAALPLSFFTSQLQAVDVGAHGMVTLRNADLSLITRHTGPDVAAVNQDRGLAASPALRALVASGQVQASYSATLPLDGLQRTFSYRRLSVAPLLVVVGLSSEDYLRDWQNDVGAAAVLGGLLLLLYGVGGAQLWRLQARNRRAQQRIELLAKVYDNSGEAIMVTDAQYRIVDINPAFVRQTGYTLATVLGSSARRMNAQRTTADQLAAIEQAVQTDGLWRGELWTRAHGGREYPVWMSVAAVRDDAGAITHRILSATDITEAKAAVAKIEHLALHDTLTQLPNRVALMGRIAQALATARRDSTGLAMLFIDMDRFKTINDTLGHHVGDGLLVQVGERLRALVRDSDVVARLGGDEFVVVLTGIALPGQHAAAAVGHKVLTALGLPYQVSGHALRSSPSIGISLFPDDGDDATALMRNADTAMYQAKANGRNGVQFYTHAMNQASSERMALEEGLYTAIERGELFLHYQPQLDLPTGVVVCVEALVRWQHPTLGLVPPLKFIPVAEDTGQIEAIGDWVLDEALRQLAQWRANGHPALRVAVNLSAQQMRGDRFVSRVPQALARHGLGGDALELEITESVAMHDPARTGVLLGQLRQHGVALAIDDFGTGHSSLAYLKQLPLSCLKLDRSFVMDIEHDPNDAAICTATIQMAHSLGLGVVAEGVETEAQLEFLRRLGCDLVQGYYISRPLAAAALAGFLQRQDDRIAA